VLAPLIRSHHCAGQRKSEVFVIIIGQKKRVISIRRCWPVWSFSIRIEVDLSGAIDAATGAMR